MAGGISASLTRNLHSAFKPRVRRRSTLHPRIRGRSCFTFAAPTDADMDRLAHSGRTATGGALSEPRLFWTFRNRVVGGVLPLALFCGGHNYFVSQLPQRRGWAPYSIHTTFQYGGAPGKRHRLREARVWSDPPEYYSAPPPANRMRSPCWPAGLLWGRA